jgi:hypothetical protein
MMATPCWENYWREAVGKSLGAAEQLDACLLDVRRHRPIPPIGLLESNCPAPEIEFQLLDATDFCASTSLI